MSKVNPYCLLLKCIKLFSFEAKSKVLLRCKGQKMEFHVDFGFIFETQNLNFSSCVIDPDDPGVSKVNPKCPL